MRLPVDTLGNPMPTPSKAESVGLPVSEWEKWWKMFLSGTLPKEYPCCSCGNWFYLSQVTECTRALLNKKSQERINTTLEEIYLCRQCKTTCQSCHAPITRFQKEMFQRCAWCC